MYISLYTNTHLFTYVGFMGDSWPFMQITCRFRIDHFLFLGLTEVVGSTTYSLEEKRSAIIYILISEHTMMCC